MRGEERVRAGWKDGRSLRRHHAAGEACRRTHRADDQRSAEAERGQDEVRKQLADIERTTQDLLDRTIEATGPSVISLYEKRLEQQEREKIVLKERASKTRAPAGAFRGLY